MTVDPHRLYNIDELDRYYYVRCAPQSPLLLLNPQVRPVHHLLAIPPVHALYAAGVQGITAHRLVNVALSVAALGLLYGILRRLEFGPRLSLAGVAVVASNPVYLALSISTLGEMMLLTFLALSIYLHYSGRPRLSLWVMGLAPLVRWEGFPVLGAWGLYHLVHVVRAREWRRLWVLGVAGLPVLAYLAVQAAVFGDPVYLMRYQAEDSYYFRLFTPEVSQRTFWENLEGVAPPILYVYGPLYVALGLLGAALTGRRHLAVKAAALMVLGFWMYYLAFLSMEAMDRRFVPVFALGVVPAVALLSRLLAPRKEGASRVAGGVAVAVLVGAMLVWNGAVFIQKADAFSGCCNDSTDLPRDTMKWIRDYTSRPGAGTVYWPVGAYRLFLLDDECTLTRSGSRFYAGPSRAAGCTYFQWHLDTVRHNVTPPGEGVLIIRGNLEDSESKRECAPSGTDPEPWARFPQDRLTAYRVHRAPGAPP
ncbi:MAG: hypothetical protein HY558_03960 [Euryarchaeota archaeon]|nr:hypothetical protein [Euryarchaeota archaeon]